MEFLWDGEEIQKSFDDIIIAVEENEIENIGKLIITSQRLIWKGENDLEFIVEIPFIVLHAISRDLEGFPIPCIYCQFDDKTSFLGKSETDEVYLIPKDESLLQDIFDALSKAAMLNPDPDLEEEYNDDLVFNREEVLSHLDSVLDTNNFEVEENN